MIFSEPGLNRLKDYLDLKKNLKTPRKSNPRNLINLFNPGSGKKECLI
jgi:hypothetical protein